MGAALAAFAAVGPGVARAQTPAPTPPILQAEQSDVATLKPITPRRVFLWGGFANPGVFIVDAEAGQMEGYIPKSDWSNFAVAPGGKAYYVAETMWTRGTRGDRQDLIAVYDGVSLNLTKEITLPGRLLSVPKAQNFAVSETGRFGYVYNMAPASSVIVVDLASQKVASVVEAPGCVIVLPYGDAGFASLCGDGTLASFAVDGAGKAVGKAKFTAPFFNPTADPVFDHLAIDVKARKAFLVSYSGMVYSVELGADSKVSPGWSLQAAAGLRAPTAEVSDIAWRPGGGQFLAYSRQTDRLFVLMHVGEGWTHKKPGTELWVLNASTHQLVKRIPLKGGASNVSVSQEDKPMVYLTGLGPTLTVLDPETGAVVRTVDQVGGGATMTAAY
jgi:methylamine dehydrogenase heavy chain